MDAHFGAVPTLCAASSANASMTGVIGYARLVVPPSLHGGRTGSRTRSRTGGRHTRPMVPPAARHLLRAKDLADSRYFETSRRDLASPRLPPATSAASSDGRSARHRPGPADPPPGRAAGSAQHRTDRDRDCFRWGSGDSVVLTSFTRVHGRRPVLTGAFPRSRPTSASRLRRARLPAAEPTFRDGGTPSVAAPAKTPTTGGYDPDRQHAVLGARPGEALASPRTLGWEGRSTGHEGVGVAGDVGPVVQDDTAWDSCPFPSPRCSTAHEELRAEPCQGRRRTLFLETDAARPATRTVGRGVVFNDPPPQPYGIDTSFRARPATTYADRCRVLGGRA